MQAQGLRSGRTTATGSIVTRGMGGGKRCGPVGFAWGRPQTQKPKSRGLGLLGSLVQAGLSTAAELHGRRVKKARTDFVDGPPSAQNHSVHRK